MNPRIPPRALTPVTISLSAVPPPDSVRVYVGGNSSVNGEANFAGTAPVVEDPVSNATYLSAKTQAVYLVGLVQTAPAGPQGSNAGNLYLQVEAVDPTTVKVLENGAKSSGFSVAAIPITVKAKEPTLGKGDIISKPAAPIVQRFWGAIYPLEFISDSGDASDLNAVQINEVIVNDPKATGMYKNRKKVPIEWFSAANSTGDRNGEGMNDPTKNATLRTMALALILKIASQKDDNGDVTGKGQERIQQYFIFSDARTGVPANGDGKGAMIVQHSGFEIRHWAGREGTNWFIRTTRIAKANRGAEAGENANSAEQPDQVKM